MTRDELLVFQKDTKLLLSSLFARKMTKIIIGAQPDIWYFCNLEYVTDKQEQNKDDFYMYRPSSNDALHSVRFKHKDAFAGLRQLIAEFINVPTVLMIVPKPLMSCLTALCNCKDAENIELKLVPYSHEEVALQITYTTPEAEEPECSTTPIGVVFDLPHIANLRQVISAMVTRSTRDDVETTPINTNGLSKSNTKQITLSVFGMAARFALADGVTQPSVNEYSKKSNLTYTITARCIRDAPGLIRMVCHYEDADLEITSIQPGNQFFPNVNPHKDPT